MLSGVGFVLPVLLLFIWGPFLLAAGFGNSKFQSRKDINSRRSKNTCFVNLAAKSGGIRITSAEAFDEVLHETSSEKPIQLVLFTAGKYDNERNRGNAFLVVVLRYFTTVSTQSLFYWSISCVHS
jgi:hypothetical protein